MSVESNNPLIVSFQERKGERTGRGERKDDFALKLYSNNLNWSSSPSLYAFFFYFFLNSLDNSK
jgi:hypothetical protein